MSDIINLDGRESASEESANGGDSSEGDEDAQEVVDFEEDVAGWSQPQAQPPPPPESEGDDSDGNDVGEAFKVEDDLPEDDRGAVEQQSRSRGSTGSDDGDKDGGSDVTDESDEAGLPSSVPAPPETDEEEIDESDEEDNSFRSQSSQEVSASAQSDDGPRSEKFAALEKEQRLREAQEQEQEQQQILQLQKKEQQLLFEQVRLLRVHFLWIERRA